MNTILILQGCEDTSSATRREEQSNTFEERFLRCRKLLYDLAYRILGNRQSAEEAVRAARGTGSENYAGFEHEGAFRSWLARILIEEALLILRRNPDGVTIPESSQAGGLSSQSLLTL